MPKPGFKSITISETVYEKFHDVYEKNKDKLTIDKKKTKNNSSESKSKSKKADKLDD